MTPVAAGPERVAIEGFEAQVRRSPLRKTLELIVDRDGELVIQAPAGAKPAALEALVRGNLEWVHRTLARKAALRQSLPRKEYVTGEGFLYLGRSHRLLLVNAPQRPLALRNGRFELSRAEAAAGRSHFVRWYTDHGRAWLPPRVSTLAARLRRQPTALKVADLGYRWASCSRNGTLHFHWAAMTLPPPVIDYLALHELLHLEIPNHGKTFWHRLETLLPDAGARRTWLAQHGSAGVL